MPHPLHARPIGPRLRFMLIAGALLTVLGFSAGPLARESFAGVQFWSTGSIGPSTSYIGNCRYYDAWDDIGLTTPAPEVYARNVYSGGGNDWAWVRYRVYVINRYTGATTSPEGWSDWQVAYDNVPAPFTTRSSGQLHLSARNPHSYRLEMRIEWWNQTAMVGAAAHRITSYRYSFSGGWSNGYDYCGYMFG